MASSSSSSSSSYDAVEKWCHHVVAQGHDLLFDPQIYLQEIHVASAKFKFPLQSLQSLLRNIHLIHVKKNAHRVKHMVTKSLLLQDYQQKGTSMVALAKRINFPPYLFARYMVEAIATTSTDQQHRKFNVAEAMRYPESKLTRDVIAQSYWPSEEERFKQGLLDANQARNNNQANAIANTNQLPVVATTTRLALEVRHAMEMDPIYGPQSDKERHLVGVEFEVVLEQELHDFQIPFETEAQLRQRGASRTPDVLLSFPVGVQVPKRGGGGGGDASDDSSTMEWKMVCWIDSKALFGDVNTHHMSVLPQLETYVHRFGPGLVLYWFGHAPLERLGDAQGDVVIVGWDLPPLMLLPDGTTVSKSSSSSLSSLSNDPVVNDHDAVTNKDRVNVDNS